MKQIILLLCSVMFTTEATSPYSKCFDRVSRRSITNYPPLAEYHLVAATTCMQNCILAASSGPDGFSICSSFTYNSQDHSCRLYDHNGYKVPAVVFPALGIDLFTRNSEKDECQGPMLNKGNVGGNPNFFKLSEKGEEAVVSSPVEKDDDFPTPKKIHLKNPIVNDITNFRTHDMPDAKDAFSQQFGSISPQDPLRRIDADVKVPSRKTEEVQEEPPKIEQKENGPCTTSTAYYVVLGTEIKKGEDTEGKVQELMDTEQGDCARLCSGNVGIHNEEFDCKSLNYYPADRKCELYSIQVEPSGPGQFLANPSAIYSEKFCLPASERICQDDEIFVLHVQKDIRGELIAAQPADGITPCLQLCLNTDGCKSAVYRETTSQCSMYTNDIGKKPKATIDTEPGAVAIENPCEQARKRARTMGSKSYSKPIKNKKSEEIDWSACSFKVDGQMVKVRLGPSGELEVRQC